MIMTALVIDDSRTAASLLVMVLNVLGIEARTAYGTSPAMATLKMETPSMVFLDINMPGLSGFDVLSFMSREPRLMSVPVFVVTSDEQPATIRQALAAGARAVLSKPISQEALKAALQKEKLI